MAAQKFDFKNFIEESKKTLLSPQEYFTSMPKTGGLVEPLIKVVLYSFTAGVIGLILGLLHISRFGGGFLPGAAAGIASIILSPIFGVIGFFIGSVVLLIISAICCGNTDFEANARVVASMSVLFPIGAFLNFTYGISIYLGILCGLAVSLYGVWLLFNALVHSLSAKPNASKIVAGIVAAIMLISTITTYTTISRISKIRKMSQKEYNMEQLMEKYMEGLPEDAKALAREALKESLKEAKERMKENE